MRFFLALLAAVTVFSATQAKAGVLLEPYVGYQFGTYNQGSGSNLTFNLSSGVIGGRLAYAFPILWVGVTDDLIFSGNATVNGTSTTINGNNVYAEVGAQLPLLRAYVDYALANNLTFQFSPTSSQMSGGTVFKIGVGTTILPMLSVNVEYLNSTYTTNNGASIPTDKSNLYRLTVGVPFSL